MHSTRIFQLVTAFTIFTSPLAIAQQRAPATMPARRATTAPAGVVARLFLENNEVEPEESLSFIVSVVNRTESVIELYPLIQLIPRILEADGSLRALRVNPLGPTTVGTVSTSEFSRGFSVVITIDGEFDEPVRPVLPIRSMLLTPISVEKGHRHLITEGVPMRLLQRGEYRIEASVWDGSTKLATSGVKNVRVARRE